MEEKINMEYLDSLSLYDLEELANFYHKMTPAIYGADIPNDLDYKLLEERKELIEAAIRRKIIRIDTNLFGSPVMKNPDAYVEKCISKNGELHR